MASLVDSLYVLILATNIKGTLRGGVKYPRVFHQAVFFLEALGIGGDFHFTLPMSIAHLGLNDIDHPSPQEPVNGTDNVVFQQKNYPRNLP